MVMKHEWEEKQLQKIGFFPTILVVSAIEWVFSLYVKIVFFRFCLVSAIERVLILHFFFKTCHVLNSSFCLQFVCLDFIKLFLINKDPIRTLYSVVPDFKLVNNWVITTVLMEKIRRNEPTNEQTNKQLFNG